MRRVGRGRGALPQRGLAAQARVSRAVGDQRGMGDRENLSQHGGHAGMTPPDEFTDKTLALPIGAQSINKQEAPTIIGNSRHLEEPLWHPQSRGAFPIFSLSPCLRRSR